jgi:hypothetical protein
VAYLSCFALHTPSQGKVSNWLDPLAQGAYINGVVCRVESCGLQNIIFTSQIGVAVTVTVSVSVAVRVAVRALL